MIGPDVHIKSDYENVFAKCPHCGQEIIFNCVSDLETTQPIGGRDVSCLRTECAKPFRIIGDSINEAYDMILKHCGELLERKRYMECVTQTCQAYEMFFNLHLYAELVYRPFAKVKDNGVAELQAMDERSERLHKAIKKFLMPLELMPLLPLYPRNRRSQKNLQTRQLARSPERALQNSSFG